MKTSNNVEISGFTNLCLTVYTELGYFYSLQPERFDIFEEFEYNWTLRLRRQVRQIIFEHFDEIVASWDEHFGGDRGN